MSICLTALNYWIFGELCRYLVLFEGGKKSLPVVWLGGTHFWQKSDSIDDFTSSLILVRIGVRDYYLVYCWFSNVFIFVFAITIIVFLIPLINISEKRSISVLGLYFSESCKFDDLKCQAVKCCHVTYPSALRPGCKQSGRGGCKQQTQWRHSYPCTDFLISDIRFKHN